MNLCMSSCSHRPLRRESTFVHLLSVRYHHTRSDVVFRPFTLGQRSNALLYILQSRLYALSAWIPARFALHQCFATLTGMRAYALTPDTTHSLSPAPSRLALSASTVDPVELGAQQTFLALLHRNPTGAWLHPFSVSNGREYNFLSCYL